MLKLNASYSKKVPVPDQEFSSQSFHASVELELSDALAPEAIRDRIHETFDLVRSSVEAELSGGESRVQPVQSAKSVERPRAADKPVPKASNKQVKFITDLATSQGIVMGELTARIRDLYGVDSLYDLDKRQASRLLDSLQDHRRKAA